MDIALFIDSGLYRFGYQFNGFIIGIPSSIESRLFLAPWSMALSAKRKKRYLVCNYRDAFLNPSIHSRTFSTETLVTAAIISTG